MDFRLGSMLDDLGYGSAEESDEHSERGIPPSSRELPANPNLDRDIALYDQRKVAEIERTEEKKHRQHTNGLTFFPPLSNDKPRTSLQIQREEEYTKPMYQINEDFRRMSVIRSGHHTGHVRHSLRSSDASVHGTPFSDQGQQRYSEDRGVEIDSMQFSNPPTHSYGQSPHPPAPTLRSLADSASSSERSSFLTPVQRKILNVVQIQHADREGERMDEATHGMGREDGLEARTRDGAGVENEAETERDSYNNTLMIADGSRVERRGRPSAHPSKDSRVMTNLRLGGLRQKRGHVIKNR